MSSEEPEDEEDYSQLVAELENNIQYMLILFSLVVGFAFTILIELLIAKDLSIAVFISTAITGIINFMGLGLGIRFVTLPNDVDIVKRFQPERLRWLCKTFRKECDDVIDWTPKDYFEGMYKFADRIKTLFFISLVTLMISICITIVYYIIIFI